MDGCLFRLHKTFLEKDSTFFRKMFATQDAGSLKGSCDELAIELNNITVGAFELLLRFVYNGFVFLQPSLQLLAKQLASLAQMNHVPTQSTTGSDSSPSRRPWASPPSGPAQSPNSTCASQTWTPSTSLSPPASTTFSVG